VHSIAFAVEIFDFFSIYSSQEEIKNHAFFRSIDWQMLYDKKVEPPYNPNVVSKALCRKTNVTYEVAHMFLLLLVVVVKVLFGQFVFVVFLFTNRQVSLT